MWQPFALVIGGVLASRDDKRGRYILGVAVAMIIVYIFAYVIALEVAEDQARYDYFESY